VLSPVAGLFNVAFTSAGYGLFELAGAVPDVFFGFLFFSIVIVGWVGLVCGGCVAMVVVVVGRRFIGWRSCVLLLSSGSNLKGWRIVGFLDVPYRDCFPGSWLWVIGRGLGWNVDSSGLFLY